MKGAVHLLDVNEFDSMKIGLASPAKIREWSHGEVTKPETINYRTLKPERDGLFCERIFGPQKDWECHCGKYKRIRNKGVVCDKCGVEVTRAKVRRERMAHIELATPVSHIWYFKGIPSRMGLILDVSPKSLERVLYFVAYIVIDPKESDLQKKQLLTELEYREKVEEFGRDGFVAKIGAEAIRDLLAEIDLDKLHKELSKELEDSSGQRRVRAVRRLEVVDAFRQSGNRPEWMIMECIPVIPPELRPMVQLDGGRFATSDLNDLYRRVINRNNRLKRLLELNAPDIIVRNEKRMLQEAVDALIDNGRRGRAVTGPGNRPLKSLSDLLKGKQGRFRQNLLGKRVDYSGRSVIVVGPELKMHQCGLPKEMALELFKPFVMKELVERGLANNIKNAKKKVEKVAPEVWDVLEDVIHEHPVLLNRAPTLHRLGIQAFEPVLWEGRAIKLHPLVCAAYNADFDGDQMACHLPLSVEAQAEARTLMLSVNNILSTKDGKPVAVPSQDMVLGAYYLTIDRYEDYCLKNAEDKYIDKDGEEIALADVLKKGVLKELVPAFRYELMPEEAKQEAVSIPVFVDYDEVMLAYDQGSLTLHQYIYVRLATKELKTEETFASGEDANTNHLVLTTPGRLIFNMSLPVALRHVEEKDGAYTMGRLMGKKDLSQLINRCFQVFGMTKTAQLLDEVKTLGFYYARKAGMTIAIADIRVPNEKWDILEKADEAVEKINQLFKRGIITEDERYRKTIEIWSDATTDVTKIMLAGMDRFNPLTMMAQSGARGNEQQIRQLAGMRGLMADPSGKIIDLPIKANFREGLTVLDYFTSSHGARKGLADTALRTADSGYLTRRLVDVAQDVIVHDDDCDIVEFDLAKEYELAYQEAEKEKEAEDAKEDAKKEAKKETESIEDVVRKKVREQLKYRFLDKKLVKPVVDASGNILFQEGDTLDLENIEILLDSDGVKKIHVRMNEIDGIEVEAIVEGTAVIEPLRDRLAGRYAAQELSYTDEDGRVIVLAHVNDFIDEKLAEEIEKHYDKVKIRSALTCRSKNGVCRMCYGRNLGTGRPVEVGEAVGIVAAQSIGEPGTQLTMRTFHTGGVASSEDITQGLPRVEELFEARKPKRCAIISDITGVVHIEDVEGNSEVKKVIVRSGNAGNLAGEQMGLDSGMALEVKILRAVNETKGNYGKLSIVRLLRDDLTDTEKKKDIGQASMLGKHVSGSQKEIRDCIDRLLEEGKLELHGNRKSLLRVTDIARRELEDNGGLVNVEEWSKMIPFGLKILVEEGDQVQKGDRLTEGSINPHDILRVLGVNATQRYLVYEVQKVYKSQGVEINDKHIEVIVRQMLRKIKVEDQGDTNFLPGIDVEREEFDKQNNRIMARQAEAGKALQPAKGKHILLGITKAALATDSFLSAASFQETTRVLTEAAIKGKKDSLVGLKENVILGKLIPAGTGMARYRRVQLLKKEDHKSKILDELNKPAESTVAVSEQEEE